jgi:hypothetical protein
VWPSQGWDNSGASWFHHADQGTQTFWIPYEWFIALEQPGVSPKPLPPISSPDYLDRFGFIPDDRLGELPIGFAHSGSMSTAHGAPWTNPATGQPMTGMGLRLQRLHRHPQ